MEAKWVAHCEEEKLKSIELLGDIEKEIELSQRFMEEIISGLDIGPALRQVKKVKDSRFDIIPQQVAEQEQKRKANMRRTPMKTKESEESIESSPSSSDITKSVHKKLNKTFLQSRRRESEPSAIPSVSEGVETVDAGDRTVMKLTKKRHQ